MLSDYYLLISETELNKALPLGEVGGQLGKGEGSQGKEAGGGGRQPEN